MGRKGSLKANKRILIVLHLSVGKMCAEISKGIDEGPKNSQEEVLNFFYFQIF